MNEPRREHLDLDIWFSYFVLTVAQLSQLKLK